MKITIDKKAIYPLAGRIQGALTDKTMSSITLRTSENILHANATNASFSVYCSFYCETFVDGAIAVPAGLLTDVLRELPPGIAKFETDSSWLTITAGHNDAYSIKIPLLVDRTWVEPPTIDSNNQTEIPSNQLAYMIQQVQFCISPESPRNYAKVAYFHKTAANIIRLVATDTFRLSYCEIEHECPNEFLEHGACVTKRALGEISRIANEGFEKVKISISPDRTTLVAEVHDYKIYIRLSAVTYPKYQGVLPNTQSSNVEVSRTTIQAMAKRVMIAADKTLALQLRFSSDSLTISSKTMGSSESKEETALRGDVAKESHLSVNGKFFSEVFTAIPGDTLNLTFESDKHPIVIIPKKEPPGCQSKHILVPIQEPN